jgi:alkylhydroperoxidase family enzyme
MQIGNSDFYRVYFNSPGAVRATNNTRTWMRTVSTLDGRLREMAIIQVGYLTKTAYEWVHHIQMGRNLGMTDDDIRAIIAESHGEVSSLPSFERAVLRASREMTANVRVTDETFAELKAHLSNEHIVDLLLAIAHYNLIVRMIQSLDAQLEPEPHNLEILRQFPLDG